MSPVLAIVIVVALVVVVGAAGTLWRIRDGRTRHPATDAGSVAAADFGIAAFAPRATIVQFSTEFCARCPQVRRLLGAIAAEHDGVEHVDVDLTHRADLAARFGVLQTPTTLLVDADGVIRARWGGVPRRADVSIELDRTGAAVHA